MTGGITVENHFPWPRRLLGGDHLTYKCLRGFDSAIFSATVNRQTFRVCHGAIDRDMSICRELESQFTFT